MGKGLWRVAVGMILMTRGSLSSADLLFSDSFNRPDGLLTNEYSFWNPNDTGAIRSPNWEMDSGSVFLQGGAAWTGIPDDRTPNRFSSNGTNSAIFRLNSTRRDYGDVEISFSLLNQGLSTSPSTPRVDWDGCHIWLRYQSEVSLYYVSVNRRDNTAVIKKKVPGGPSNGGTYYTLSPGVSHPVRYNSWQNVRVSAQNNRDGSVSIRLYDGQNLLLSATDNGAVGGPPIRSAGRVGIRGDNANLKFDNFTVNSLNSSTSTVLPPSAPLRLRGRW